MDIGGSRRGISGGAGTGLAPFKPETVSAEVCAHCVLPGPPSAAAAPRQGAAAPPQLHTPHPRIYSLLHFPGLGWGSCHSPSGLSDVLASFSVSVS